MNHWTIAGSNEDRKRWDWKTCSTCGLTDPKVTGEPPRCADPATCRAVLAGGTLGGKPMLNGELVRYDDPGPEAQFTHTTNGVS